MRKKVKIAFIITSLTTGGAQIMLLKLLETFDRKSFTPLVITLRSKGDLGHRIEALGIIVHSLNMKQGVPSFFKMLLLTKLLREFNADVVHTWMYHADLVGGLAAKLAGVRSVIWGIRHSNLSPDHNKRTTLLVMKACALISKWLPHRILICSERAQATHVAAGYCADKFMLIPNGFDLNNFAPNAQARDSVRSELSVPLDTLLVGLIARYDPQKNHLGFVQAAAMVHKAFPDVHFVLAGAGVDTCNVELVNAIQQIGLRFNFYLLGRREDVPRLMASLDVLVSASIGEAFPNVLGEAMACGVPCVVTDVGDSAEIVGDTGRVVASDDMTKLAENLIHLLELPFNQRRDLGARARERVHLNYDIAEITRRYEDVYLKTVDENNKISCK